MPEFSALLQGFGSPADLYRELGKSLLESERPPSLSAEERDAYDVLLEEQAFPFEEKAIEIHEANARRAADGVYDEWVRKSYTSLAELKPARYARAIVFMRKPDLKVQARNWYQTSE